MGLTGVLDYHDAGGGRHLVERVHIDRLAVQVHRNDRNSPRSQRRLDSGRGHEQG